jgi:hypothetical protein
MESVSNNISRLQQFLNEQNCIDKESIKEAKRIYWNTQKALWRQNQRKQNKAISLMLNKKEYAVISKQAKRHNLSVTKYSKLAMLAYSSNSIIQLDPMLAARLREILVMIYHQLRDMREDGKIGAIAEESALFSLEQIKEQIDNELYKPKRLQTAIAEFISIEPENKHIIIDLLNAS